MAVRVAVITDSLSNKFVFPHWYRYYSSQFGGDNIFLVTYAGMSQLFEDFKLGGLVQLPVGFDDETRRAVISNLVTSLLACYDVVVRVDADEFLVVDPDVAPSLAAFIETFDEPYLTARGFDVTQMLDEPPIAPDDDAPILQNRAYAYPNSALNKTCMVKQPVTWSAGFHWATVPPKFGPLFMLHMKRLDINWQLAWYAHVSAGLVGNAKVPDDLRNYYHPDRAKILKYHSDVQDRVRLSGVACWYRNDFIAEFLAEMTYRESNQLYCGSYGHEHVLCEIPAAWKML